MFGGKVERALGAFGENLDDADRLARGFGGVNVSWLVTVGVFEALDFVPVEAVDFVFAEALAAPLAPVLVFFEPLPPLVSRTTTTITTTTMPASSAAPPRLETGGPGGAPDAREEAARSAESRAGGVGAARGASAGEAWPGADCGPVSGAPASASRAAWARSRTALSGMASSSATWA